LSDRSYISIKKKSFRIFFKRKDHPEVEGCNSHSGGLNIKNTKLGIGSMAVEPKTSSIYIYYNTWFSFCI